MATIRKYLDKFDVQIRKKGYPFVSKPFLSLTVAKYRDARLKEVSHASLKRELVIIRRVLTLASKDWGIALPHNPVKMISLPKITMRPAAVRCEFDSTYC